MSTLFDWFKIASKEPEKKSPDSKTSASQEPTNFSRAILALMSKSKHTTNGYYKDDHIDPKSEQKPKDKPSF